MRSGYWALAVATMVALPQQTANAQQASKSQAERVTPLQIASMTKDAVLMIAGQRPKARPSTPVTIWVWAFRRDETNANAITYDTSARLVTMDCAAKTSRTTLIEAFRNGNLVHTGASKASATAVKPGSAGESQLRMACEPDFRPNAQTYPDHLAARAAALTHFARQPAAATPQTVQPAQRPAAQPAKPPPAPPAAAPGTGVAARVGGPLRVFHTTAAFTMMTTTRPPATQPTAPFETWRWIFSRLVVEEKGHRYDAMAYRVIVDCARRTVSEAAAEYFRNGVVVYAERKNVPALVPKPGTGEYEGLRTECEPGHNANAQTYADYRAARAAIPLTDGLARAAVTPQPSAASSTGAVGEAERAGGPLRLVNVATDRISILAGSAPTARPTRPIEAWTWVFYREPQTANGRQHDALATLVRIDCSTGEETMLRFETYRRDVLDRKAAPPAQKALKAPPGSVVDRRIRFACEPGFNPGAATYPNHKAARLAVSIHFALKEKAPQAVAAASAANVGEAARAGSPQRLSGTAPDHFYTLAGPAPSVRPTRPFEAWSWAYYRQPRSAAGVLNYDALATLQRIDCAGGTITALRFEAFLNGNLNEARASKDTVSFKPKPGTGGHNMIRLACEPGFNRGAATYADHKAARAAAIRHFASKKK